jgi:hypothetical protein
MDGQCRAGRCGVDAEISRDESVSRGVSEGSNMSIDDPPLATENCRSAVFAAYQPCGPAAAPSDVLPRDLPSEVRTSVFCLPLREWSFRAQPSGGNLKHGVAIGCARRARNRRVEEPVDRVVDDAVVDDCKVSQAGRSDGAPSCIASTLSPSRATVDVAVKPVPYSVIVVDVSIVARDVESDVRVGGRGLTIDTYTVFEIGGVAAPSAPR